MKMDQARANCAMYAKLRVPEPRDRCRPMIRESIFPNLTPDYVSDLFFSLTQREPQTDWPRPSSQAFPPTR